MEPDCRCIIQSIKWISKCVIFVGIWIDVLGIVEFRSWSISIQIQSKAVQSINDRLHSKRPKHCVNTFGPVTLIMQKNRPGCFVNIPKPLLNNTILMVSTDATEGNCLVAGF